MIKAPLKSMFLVASVMITLCFLFPFHTAKGESWVPPPPDPSVTLPANDGGPNGCNSTRFKCVMGGEAVLDKQTGLTWVRNAQIAGKKLTWKDAVKFCQTLELGNQKGWRLPTKDEIIIFMDSSQSSPVLPEGHPFNNVVEYGKGEFLYWTNTKFKDKNEYVWIVNMINGMMYETLKMFDMHAWPVLDKQ